MAASIIAIQEPVPEIVYHYTSIDTMMKIVETKEIWATSVCYLNDTSEQRHFLNLVRERLPSIEFSNPEDREATASFQTVDDDGFVFRPFVASFSADSDSLPQWRSYCNAGNGVAIGFSTNCLCRAAIKTEDPSTVPLWRNWSNHRFDKVRYPDEYRGIDAEIVDILDKSKSGLRLIEELNHPEPCPVALPQLFGLVLGLRSCLMKSASFQSENEYRIVVDTLRPRYELFGYRTSRSCMIPYLKLPIPCFEEGHDKYPTNAQFSNPRMSGRYQFIKRVVVGPTPNMTLTVDTLIAFFRSNRLLVDVVPSTVSFRDW